MSTMTNNNEGANMTDTVTVGATVWDGTDPGRLRFVEANHTHPYIVLGAGEFVVRSHNDYRTIGVLTGRTRKFWRQDCPTIKRYEVETVVIDGALWGVRGAALPGTYVVRPENIVEGRANA